MRPFLLSLLLVFVFSVFVGCASSSRDDIIDFEESIGSSGEEPVVDGLPVAFGSEDIIGYFGDMPDMPIIVNKGFVEAAVVSVDASEISVAYTNLINEILVYGAGFELEKLDKDEWVEIPYREEFAFTLLAYSLAPGEQATIDWEFAMPFGLLEPGHYRMCRLLHQDHPEDPPLFFINVRVEFEI